MIGSPFLSLAAGGCGGGGGGGGAGGPSPAISTLDTVLFFAFIKPVTVFKKGLYYNYSQMRF